MKKILHFCLLAAVMASASCSRNDEPVYNDSLTRGMVLRATVDQAAATRATLSDGSTWTFAFSEGDNVFVRNDNMSPYNHYMFVKGADDFACAAAVQTVSPESWYAYFPQVGVYLGGQSGSKESVANLYALSGTTADKTTGEDGLSIALSPQVALLEIDNQKGPIDINVKTGPDTWVNYLSAKTGAAGFDLVTAEEKISLLTVSTAGVYYIAVPAGVQLCIKDGDTEIASTTAEGFSAGKYYELTVVKPKFTVSFDAKGHGTAPSALSEVLFGSTIDEPTDPTSPAASFGGWFKDESCTESWDFASDIVTCETTLYAKWAYTARGTASPSNWVQLWENGPKFAEYNVGSSGNKTTELDGYYCWGKHTNKNAVPSIVKNETYKGGYSALSGDDDTATHYWGENWRIPTKSELENLIKNCDTLWIADEEEDLYGLLFTGKGEYWESSVFFPAAGYSDVGDYGHIYRAKVEGNYWTSTPDTGDESRAYLFYFKSSDATAEVIKYTRYPGHCIRAVYTK